ncbi:MAG: protein-L-isoaspartate(D-aspartate) O-methyltransferase [Desulforhabdus sp.]|jgi:protein-L-isoaspartate(D-aspartate) O-methyltransferase|nr:protein-L-isoaspartate(D-aspartate) O-methyltransferase [Desulforhabdus sp.]
MKIGYLALLWLLLLTLATPSASAADSPYSAERRKMIEEIEADVKMTSERIGKRSLNPHTMEAMGKVPRHEFVSGDLKRRAYENRPLPIGYGQTISQPYIVAIMTDLAEVDKDQSVLEIGTGSGYQAAVLAECGAKVYSIEIIEELAESATQRLQHLGYDRVEVRSGDGYYGWEEHAPFDAIIVTAAANHIPPPLVQQLKPGGRMIIPVGGPFMTQHLMLVEKREDSRITTRQVLPVLFVPLTGGH